MLQLQGISYEWDDTQTGSKRPEGIMYGFSAQNIQEVFPTLVSSDHLGFLQTAYGTYDAMYVESIRALYNRIQQLEADNKKLIANRDELKSDIDKLNAAVFGLGALKME